MGKHHFRIQYIIKGQQCRLWITPPEQKNMMNKTQLEMHLKKKHRTVNTQFQGSHSKTENIAVLEMDGTDRRRRMKLKKKKKQNLRQKNRHKLLRQNNDKKY
jgi:hypothetical protein